MNGKTPECLQVFAARCKRFSPIGPHRLEKVERSPFRNPTGDYERFGCKISKGGYKFADFDAVPVCDGVGGVQVKQARKNRCSPKNGAFWFLQKIVAPVDHSLQSLMARQSRAASLIEHVESIVKQHKQLGQIIGIDSCCR